MPEPSRDRWATRSAFILAAIGSAVGLGNIWRFPHVAYNSGGGAFFIPYFIALFTAGIPLLMLEYGLGHRMQGSAPTSMGRVNKRFEFVGWWAALGGLMITFYYTIIMAWVCFYLYELIAGFVTGAAHLPWEENGAAHYLYNNVVTNSPNHTQAEGDFSRLNGPAILFNGFVWGFIYYAIRNGVHSVGKVVWVTVLLPYVLLFILFFTAIRLNGASSGLSYYLAPDWSKFSTLDGIVRVASNAYGQIFFSLSIGFGIMMAYASFLPKKSDIANNAIITSFANSGTEFFGGFITFAVLGFMALSQGKFVGDVVGDSSFALALISYPTTISMVSDSVAVNASIGLAFFGCLLFLGIDSAFSLVEAMVAGVCDKFSVSRKAVSAIFCLIGWAVGVVFCTPGGLSLLDVVDHYLSNYGLLIIGLIQCLVVGWVYRAARLRDHINRVSEKRITPFWDFCVRYLTPAVLIFLLGYQMYSDLRFLWDADATAYSGYTAWSQLAGVSTVLVGLVLAIWLARRKSEKHDFGAIPEFDYDKP